MQVSRAAGAPAPPNFNVRVGEARELIFLAAATFVSTLNRGVRGLQREQQKYLHYFFRVMFAINPGGGGAPHSADPVPTRPRLYHVI